MIFFASSAVFDQSLSGASVFMDQSSREDVFEDRMSCGSLLRDCWISLSFIISAVSCYYPFHPESTMYRERARLSSANHKVEMVGRQYWINVGSLLDFLGWRVCTM